MSDLISFNLGGIKIQLDPNKTMEVRRNGKVVGHVKKINHVQDCSMADIVITDEATLEEIKESKNLTITHQIKP